MWRISVLCYLLARLDVGWSILNGKVAAPGSWPFVVQVHWVNSSEVLVGAGIIINPYTVMTKIKRGNSKIKFVKAGNHFLNKQESTEQIREVCSQTVHPEFGKDGTHKYGWHLIHLTKPFTFNDRVSAAELAPPGYTPTAECRLIGWGNTVKNGVTNSPELREVTTKFQNMQPPNICGGGTPYNHDTLVCIESGGCMQDFGAPLVCSENPKLVYGIVVGIYQADCDHTLIALLPKMPRAWIVSELEKAVKVCGCGKN